MTLATSQDTDQLAGEMLGELPRRGWPSGGNEPPGGGEQQTAAPTLASLDEAARDEFARGLHYAREQARDSEAGNAGQE